MAKVEKLSPFILKWEGGFSNDPNDAGGATMKGVTISTYKAYCAKNGKKTPTVAQLKKITNEEWTDILKTMYWDKARADEITSQRVAGIIVDWVWMSGTGILKNVQRCLGVQADGIVGAKTIAAINNANPDELFNAIYNVRSNFYHSIVASRPANGKFLNGWMNRLRAIRDYKF